VNSFPRSACFWITACAAAMVVAAGVAAVSSQIKPADARQHAIAFLQQAVAEAEQMEPLQRAQFDDAVSAQLFRAGDKRTSSALLARVLQIVAADHDSDREFLAQMTARFAQSHARAGDSEGVSRCAALVQKITGQLPERLPGGAQDEQVQRFARALHDVAEAQIQLGELASARETIRPSIYISGHDYLNTMAK